MIFNHLKTEAVLTTLQKKVANKIERGNNYKTYVLRSESNEVLKVQSRNFYEAQILLFNRYPNMNFLLLGVY